MPANLERVAVGKIAGVFGIKGWVKIKSDTEPEENIVCYSPWFVCTQHGIKTFEVDAHTMRPQGLVVHLVGIDNRDQAEELGRARIEVEKSLLPELPTGDYYWHELLGLRVVTVSENAQLDLGRIERIMETGANDVLVVKGDERSVDDKERLIPYVPGEFVHTIDLQSGQMIVDWDPEF